jgi:hypothetical protein
MSELAVLEAFIKSLPIDATPPQGKGAAQPSVAQLDGAASDSSAGGN